MLNEIFQKFVNKNFFKKKKTFSNIQKLKNSLPSNSHFKKC